MHYNLFLDDIRTPNQVTWVDLPLVDWVIVRNFEQFRDTILEKGAPNQVSFDHDLGPAHYVFDWAGDGTKPEQPTGYDCAKWLANHCYIENKPLPEYYVHSLNPIGADNIDKYLKSYLRTEKYKK